MHKRNMNWRLDRLASRAALLVAAFLVFAATAATPRLFLWVELIGFDNTKPDYGVTEYLSRHDLRPEAVSLLMDDDAFLFVHRPGLPQEVELPPHCCSYGARPFNPERRRQKWTSTQLRGLVAELKKNGLDVFASFFARHDSYPVSEKRIAEVAPKIASFLRDYGFTGLHGSDGYAPPRYLLPACSDADRARIARESAAKYAANWAAIVKAVKKDGMKVWINTCWTRDPYEALYRYGVDYRLLVKAGVDGFVVESSAACQEIIEGWNDGHRSAAIDRSMAMLMRLKACVPNTPLVLLHAINDGNEQWSALRHAPTRSASEALCLGAVFYGRKRALEGFLACLADGVKREEWKTLGGVWRLALRDAAGPEGVRVVWSDKAFDREFDVCSASRDANSNTLLYELIRNGAVIGGSISVADALKDKSLPLLVLNPEFFPAEELAALRDRASRVIEFGRGAAWPYNEPYEMLPAGTPAFPGMPYETSCYWKKPIPENMPSERQIKDCKGKINWATTSLAPQTSGLRLSNYRLADGRRAILARNESAKYMNAAILFKTSISDVTVLRDFPSLPVSTSLSLRIAPYDTAVLAVGEHDQPIPGDRNGGR